MNPIKIYLCCRTCSQSNLADKIAVGRTDFGICIWCTRHNTEIAHFPYEWSDHETRCQCESCGKKV